jgi:hypothetical protein
MRLLNSRYFYHSSFPKFLWSLLNPCQYIMVMQHCLPIPAMYRMHMRGCFLLLLIFFIWLHDLPNVCFLSPFNDSGLFWQKKWGKESIVIDKGYHIKSWSCRYGWSCLCGSLQYHATWWRPSGLCIPLTCWHTWIKHCRITIIGLGYHYNIIRIFGIDTWHFTGTSTLAYKSAALIFTWILIFRLDLMQEECSLFIQNAWRQTTLPAGLSEWMQYV